MRGRGRSGAVVGTTAVLAVLALAGCGASPAQVAAARQTPLPVGDSWHPGLFVSGYGPLGLAPSAAASASASDSTLSQPDQALLDSVSIKDSDFTGGWQVHPIDQGTTLDAPTLGLCDAPFPSEQQRVARRQVATFDAKGAGTGTSSEAVLYSTPRAAQQALAELVAARQACHDGQQVADGSSTATVTFHPAPGPTDTPLVDAAHRVVLQLVYLRADGSSLRALDVWQVRGRLLDILYVVTEGAQPYDQATLDRAFALAGVLADRMRAVAPAAVDATSG